MRFAHDSERLFAELLDYYEVRWEYEPVEFVLSWGLDGQPTSAFRPDFYLNDHSLFLELTTLRQELVTRKNRKVRRLKALYPDINIRVLYRSDYANLLKKAHVQDVKEALGKRVVASTMTPSQKSA